MKKYTIYEMIREIVNEGRKSSPRGQEILEIEYFQGEIINPFSNYLARKYPVDYLKREMQLYLNADPFDTRICKFAKMWNKLIQPDGSILSNYGAYWFGPQNGFKWVIDTLTKDPDSRQAYIAMNNYHHAYSGNSDFVCTKGIQFRVVDGGLNTHVSMRSSDVIYGIASDLPCFWMLWQMVACELDLALGKFIFSTDSLHLYEKHYEMAEDIVVDGPESCEPVNMPAIADAQDLLSGRFESEFGKWVSGVSLDD